MSIDGISSTLPARSNWRNTESLSPIRRPAGTRAIGPKSGKDPNHAFDEEEREASGHDQLPDHEGNGSATKRKGPGHTVDRTV